LHKFLEMVLLWGQALRPVAFFTGNGISRVNSDRPTLNTTVDFP